MVPVTRPAWAIASRFIAAVFAGYAAAVGLVSLCAVALALLLGVTRAQALVLATMLGFLAYAAIILWGFVEPRLGRIWGTLAAVAVASHAAAILLARLFAPVGGGA